MITCLAGRSVIVAICIMLGMSTSVRLFCPFTFVVVVGDGAAPPPIAAMPPSTVVVCTTATSACRAVEHSANTVSDVISQRFIKASRSPGPDRQRAGPRESPRIVSPPAGHGQDDGQRDLDISHVGHRIDVGPLVGGMGAGARTAAADGDRGQPHAPWNVPC